MPTRRQALGALVWPVLPGACAPRAQWVGPGTAQLPPVGRGSPADAARDEDYWAEVGRAFTVDRTVLNLNNAAVSPSPGIVQQAMARHLALANSVPPPHALWSVAPPQREVVRQRLAAHWGVDAEEIAITRNTSEGLEALQLGFDLARGDEVLTSTQDYPRMIAAFQQRERREGIVLRQFQIPVPVEDPAKIVALYESNLTPKTRLILMCHMINLTGQIMPVREVVAMARKRGVPVIVDGSQSLAQFEFKISDLDCDYFATSLHKWLFAPHGTGLLYVRKDKIRGVWPLMTSGAEWTENIRKFEDTGTRPEAANLAIAEALTFHQAIGGARKEARLIYLRDIWVKRLLATKRVRVLTNLKPTSPRLSCAIATIEVDGLEPARLMRHLWDKHRIETAAMVHKEFAGLRISPSVYTTLEELDRFCTVMEQVIKTGLPAA